MKRLSIEIAHTYKEWGQEQERGLQVLEEFILNTDHKNFDLCILVDNYHETISEDLVDLIKIQTKNQATISLEADFEEKALELIQKLPVDLKDQKVFLKGTNILLKKGTRVTCPILTAAWYLHRLESSDSLLNILPLKFLSNEKKVKNILNYLNFKEISYIFFDEGQTHEGL